MKEPVGKGVVAGLAGGAASLFSQFFLRTALDLGPRLSDLYPELFGTPVGWDILFYCLFILAESALLGYLYALLEPRLPGGVWLKGLIFGLGLWVAVNLLPLLGASALLHEPLEVSLTFWSLTWLVFILVQALVTALSFQGLTARRSDG
ncbi:MAG TPA: hypothetical protein ENN88_01340 [Candidatus Coatesbacteria bacterium]|nr:hypothetical protein [Candidatus Coatesbacteria bacterium]